MRGTSPLIAARGGAAPVVAVAGDAYTASGMAAVESGGGLSIASGDTRTIAKGDTTTVIRLAGIAAPKSCNRLGQRSLRTLLQELATLESGQPPYSRIEIDRLIDATPAAHVPATHSRPCYLQFPPRRARSWCGPEPLFSPATGAPKTPVQRPRDPTRPATQRPAL